MNLEYNPVSLFRYQCIQPLVDAPDGERHAVLKKLVGKVMQQPNGKDCRLSRATLLRWLSAYRQARMDGLKPRKRKDRGVSRKIDGETAQALLRLKEQKPRLSLNALIYLARRDRLIAPGRHLPKISVYRLLKRHNLIRPLPQITIDRRRFEAEYPLDLVQADVMHGPRIKGRKAYLTAIIDDHSRLILWAEFRPQETVGEFIAVLLEALRRRGLPRKLYVDNGSAFRSSRLQYALAGIGVSLVHSTPYQPEGKGKCERWFRTVRENFLPQIPLAQLESFAALNEALHSWIDGYYHQTVHSTTGQTPLERFVQHLHAHRPAPDGLEAMFRNRCLRRVAKDRVVSLNGKAWEAPPGCIGKRLELRYDPRRPDEVEAFDDARSLGILKPVMPHSNARIMRAKNNQFEIEAGPEKAPPATGQVPFAAKDFFRPQVIQTKETPWII